MMAFELGAGASPRDYVAADGAGGRNLCGG